MDLCSVSFLSSNGKALSRLFAVHVVCFRTPAEASGSWSLKVNASTLLIVLPSVPSGVDGCLFDLV